MHCNAIVMIRNNADCTTYFNIHRYNNNSVSQVCKITISMCILCEWIGIGPCTLNQEHVYSDVNIKAWMTDEGHPSLGR